MLCMVTMVMTPPPSHRLTGMSPFLGDDDMETVANIATGEYEYPDPEDSDNETYEDISSLAKEFIDHLLILNPS